MGLTHWSESDNAADARRVLINVIAKTLDEHIEEEEGNEYNTPGYIDAALIIEELFFNGSDPINLYSEGDMLKVVKIILDRIKAEKELWTDSDLQSCIERMISNLQKLVDHNAG